MSIHAHICASCKRLRTCTQGSLECSQREYAHVWVCCDCQRADEALDAVLVEWFDRIEKAQKEVAGHVRS